MKNLFRYNRIMAGAIAAALLVANLGSAPGVVLAAENPDETEVTEVVEETTETEEVATEETKESAEVTETEENTTEETTESTEETKTEETTETPEEKTEEPTEEKSEEKTEEPTEEKSEEKSEESTEEKSEEKSEEETENKVSMTETLDCTEDHEHTAGCYVYVDADGKKWNLTCTEDHEHTADCYTAVKDPEVIDEGGDAEDQDTVVTYEAETDGITVKAEALGKALPEGATLHVVRIEDDDELETVTEVLDESDVTYDDYLALDIHFDDTEGNEIEPDGAVKVSFELAHDLLPENYNKDSLTVQHLEGTGENAESKDAKDINVVTVADTTDNSDTGTIQVTAADDSSRSHAADARNVSAEFEVTTFSTFTITWNANWGNTKKSIDVTAYDEDGNVLAETAVPATLTYNGGTDVDLDGLIDGYQFVKATVYVNNNTYENVTKVKWTRDWSTWTLTMYFADGTSKGLDNVSNTKMDAWYERATYTVTYDHSIKMSTGGTSATAVKGDGDTHDPQSGLYGSAIVLPDCEATATVNGVKYVFAGWTEEESWTTATQFADMKTLYQPGTEFILSKDVTLRAVWVSSEAATTNFFIRLDGVIPSRTDTGTSADKYTQSVKTGQYTGTAKWYYDNATTTDPKTDKDGDGKEIRSYIENSVTDQVANDGLPNNTEIAAAVNYRYDTTKSIDYHVAVRTDASQGTVGELYVDKVRINGMEYTTGNYSAGGYTIGEPLYVQWYTQKYQNTSGTLYTWHIDGILLAKDEVAIIYNANTNEKCTDMPSGYQVSEGTSITVGVSGKASGTVSSPQRSGYTLLGWNTEPDGSGTAIANGSSYTLNSNTTLYAMWSQTNGVGNLRINKVVTGTGSGYINPDTTYTIAVSIPETQLDGNPQYKATVRNSSNNVVDHERYATFNGGVETFTLKNGQYLFIENLPDGATYEVSETGLSAGYTVTYTDANGRVLANGKGQIVNATTKEMTITNSVRVIKTGVDVNGIPQAAMFGILLAGATLFLFYRRFRRDLTRNG